MAGDQKDPILFFPHPYPDESLLSTIARYHHCIGNKNPHESINELFNIDSSHVMFKFPTNISSLITRIRGAHSYTAKKVLYQHTTYPLYACFLHLFQRIHLEDVLINGKKEFTPWFKSNIGSKKLKCCSECIKTDLEIIGEPYWHNCHQIDLVYLCPHHETILMNQCPRCSRDFLLLTKRGFALCSRYCECGFDLTIGTAKKITNFDYLHFTNLSKGLGYLMNNWEALQYKLPDNWSLYYRSHYERRYSVNSYKLIPYREIYQQMSEYYGSEILLDLKVDVNRLKRLFWIESKGIDIKMHILLLNFITGSLLSYFDSFCNVRDNSIRCS